METRELWHISKNKSTIKEARLSLSDEDDLLIRSHYSLISPGTEKIVSRGLVPENLYEEMKVPYMKGEFHFPVSYGYSLVGEIQEGSSDLPGQYIHCLYPHHSYGLIRKDDAFPIPEGMPLKRATLASNMETVVNAIWDSHVSIGDNVLVAGFGNIGALLSLTLKTFPGVSVSVLETDPVKQDIADQLGLLCYGSPEEINTRFDMAFNCTSNEQGLQTCIDKTGLEGKIIELSWYGTGQVKIGLGGTFHSERKRIIASQVSRIPDEKASRWNNKRRKELVFELLKNPEYDELITREVNFEDTPQFFDALREGNNNNIGIVIKY